MAIGTYAAQAKWGNDYQLFLDNAVFSTVTPFGHQQLPRAAPPRQ